MSYSLSTEAEEDIISIFIEGGKEFGVNQAQAYHLSLSNTFELLSQNPELAQQRFEINPPVRIYPFQSHLIVYLVDSSNNILVVRVRHQKEGWFDG